jgi:hypothetical protein
MVGWLVVDMGSVSVLIHLFGLGQAKRMIDRYHLFLVVVSSRRYERRSSVIHGTSTWQKGVTDEGQNDMEVTTGYCKKFPPSFTAFSEVDIQHQTFKTEFSMFLFQPTPLVSMKRLC